MTESNESRRLIEIFDEVEWHELITNPIIYIEDAGLDGVRWVFIAHWAEHEQPNEDVDNDHLLEGDSFEPRWTVCEKCFVAATNSIAKEIFEKSFGDKPDGK